MTLKRSHNEGKTVTFTGFSFLVSNHSKVDLVFWVIMMAICYTISHYIGKCQTV